MNILFLSTDEPADFSFGGSQRNSLILQALQRIAQVDVIVTRDEEVETLATDWGPDRMLKVAIPHGSGRLVRLKALAVARKLVSRALAEKDYDFIVARYFGRAALVPRSAHAKLVIDGDDVRRNAVGASSLRRMALRLRAGLIRAVAKRAHHIWLVDPRDRDILDAGRTRTSILPNTAKSPRTPLATPARTGLRMLMVGLYSYPPNEEGLIWFARHVLPRIAAEFPGLELHAVGRYHQTGLNALGHAVRMRGFVDDLSAEYAQADVVICPILSGTGTQIKVIEALMHARPTVVSSFTYRGFADALTLDQHLLVAHDVDEWVRHLSEVLRAPSRFRSMAERGRNAAMNAYNEGAFADRVIATFQSKV